MTANARESRAARYRIDWVRRLAEENATLNEQIATDLRAKDESALRKDAESVTAFSARVEAACHFAPILAAKGSAARDTDAGTKVVSERLAPSEIQRVVRASFSVFRKCYEEGLGRDPNLQGRVAVKFTIETDGRVSHAGDAGSTLPDRRAVGCVTRGYEALRFPPPDGGIVTVVYPIIFNPAD